MSQANKEKYLRYAEILRKVKPMLLKPHDIYICNQLQKTGASFDDVVSIRQWIQRQLCGEGTYGNWLCGNHLNSFLESFGGHEIEGRLQWIDAMVAQLEVWAGEE